MNASDSPSMVSSAEPLQPRGHATGRRRWLLAGVLAVLAALLALGLWPRFIQAGRVADAQAGRTTRPRVTVVPVRTGPATVEIALPASVEALTEVALHSRADGYVRRRLADIGDRVSAGQVLAEIESPELAEQIRQAEAAERRAHAGLRQTEAASEQARANLQLAAVTLQRWSALVAKGVLSQQDGDEKQTAQRARQAEVAAMEANVAAARDAVDAARADRRRLLEVQGFRRIRAPFDGIVTMRNTEVGALVSIGSSASPLFRVAALDHLRVLINVPQSEAAEIRIGTACQVTVNDVPGRGFAGRVSRTSQALDAGSRTLLTEIVMDNPGTALRPGMAATVRLTLKRDHPPLLIPAAAFRTGEGGPRVAVIDAQGVVHLRAVELGRDHGTVVEVRNGLEMGERVASTLSDDLVEGTMVEAVAPPSSPARPAQGQKP
jgi:RND family efflux transporter MFP subunit